MPTFITDRARGHALLPDKHAASLPSLYTHDGHGKAAPAAVKLFSPNTTIFLTEFDGNDVLFGYLCSPYGHAYNEWTYFSLNELACAIRTDLPGHPLWERDLDFQSGTRVGEAIATLAAETGTALS